MDRINTKIISYIGILAILFFYATGFNLQQEDNQDSIGILKLLNDSILHSKNEKTRISSHHKFRKKLVELLERPYSYNYDIRDLDLLSVVKDDEKELRIITWAILLDNGTFKYFGILQIGDKDPIVYRLNDINTQPSHDKSWEFKTLLTSNWYGAKYSDLLKVERNKKSYYVLLGWRGINLKTQQKVIESLSVEKKQPFFGLNVFRSVVSRRKTNSSNPFLGSQFKKVSPHKFKKRVIFEYDHRAYMMLKFDATKQKILFDHLAPQDVRYKGQYQFYGPDLTYDGYFLDKKKWLFYENLDLRNPPSDRDSLYINPER